MIPCTYPLKRAGNKEPINVVILDVVTLVLQENSKMYDLPLGRGLFCSKKDGKDHNRWMGNRHENPSLHRRYFDWFSSLQTDVCFRSSFLKSTPQLRLIDYGRAIDMQSYPPNTAFMAKCGTSGFECIQMTLKRPWSYHVRNFDFFVWFKQTCFVLFDELVSYHQEISFQHLF